MALFFVLASVFNRIKLVYFMLTFIFPLPFSYNKLIKTKNFIHHTKTNCCFSPQNVNINIHLGIISTVMVLRQL